MSPPTVAVLVTSCDAFCRATLPPLLASLDEAGVPRRDVFVVAGDAQERARTEVCGQTVTLVTWCNMDNNGLLWAVSDEGLEALAAYDWLFYVHDTTVAMPHFAAGLRDCLAEQLARDPEVAAVCLHAEFSMSMGYYRLSALREIGPWLLSTASHDHDPARKLEVKTWVEDSAFRRIGDTLGGGRVGCIDSTYSYEDGLPSPYGGVPRRREAWPRPGLYKYKGSWCLSRLQLSL